MSDAKPINAGPTKAFFVKMLTRDIELADAILDLLDNCVDGVVRTLNQGQIPTNGKPYQNFYAHITATPTEFEIVDNCGGIPQDIAEKSAFMLGRHDITRDADVETVGMYGIGMKRAMFKMGRRSVVTSQPSTGPYKVEIPPEWLDDEPMESGSGVGAPASDPWKLQLVPLSTRLEENGTKISVTELYPEISRQFDKEKSPFLTDLEKEISRHYALILGKGFTVTLNGPKCDPVNLTILAPREIGVAAREAIEPYVFQGVIGGVQVDLAVGFYRPLATEAELEDDDGILSSRENAGWTVICNNRVVLYNDKTYKTGWGTKGVTPAYHNQFISIRGIVSFRSTDSMALPLNTTKRGLATDSFLYQAVIGAMRTGLKDFTSFTNRWKKREEETTAMFQPLSQKSLTQIIGSLKKGMLSPVRTQPGCTQYAPSLPKPDPQHKQRRICFAADQEDIEVVAEHYFDNSDHDRSEVAKRCFDESLRRAKRGA